MTWTNDPAMTDDKEARAHMDLGYWRGVARDFREADWDHWLSLQSWTLRETACLLTELDPRGYDKAKSNINPLPQGLVERIADIERRADREQKAGRLRDDPSPTEWAEWAKVSGYALPKRLRAELEALKQAQPGAVSVEKLAPDSEGDAVRSGADETTKRNKWTDVALKALWQESLLPGMTQKVLAEKFGVTHQSISKQLKRASERFSKTKSKASAKKKTWLS